MVKISKSGNQYTINLPKDIVKMKGWDENTELKLIPFLKEINEEMNEKTPIIMKEVED